MQPTQLQNEIIEAARSEGQLDPSTFARVRRHDLGDVDAALHDLVAKGWLDAAEGDTYRLTEQGENYHRGRAKAHRAAVLRRTRSWQRR